MPAKSTKPKTTIEEIEADAQFTAPPGRALPLWSAGLGGLFAREHVVAIGRWDSAPIRRAVRQARQTGRLIDLTFGYACKSVIFMDTGQVVLSSSLHFWPEPVPFQPDPDDDRLLPKGA